MLQDGWQFDRDATDPQHWLSIDYLDHSWASVDDNGSPQEKEDIVAGGVNVKLNRNAGSTGGFYVCCLLFCSRHVQVVFWQVQTESVLQ